MDQASIFIDINNSFIDINKWIIDINNSFIDINKDGCRRRIATRVSYSSGIVTACQAQRQFRAEVRVWHRP